ncbi:MAG: hypothetical protein P4M02_00955 [Clostridia bacterium]|nr:hypothetical protein [Clostridia bacterium]
MVVSMADCPEIAKATPESLSYLATTIGVTIAQDLDIDTVGMLSSFFFNIGSTLGLIARQRALQEDCRAKEKEPPKGK